MEAMRGRGEIEVKQLGDLPLADLAPLIEQSVAEGHAMIARMKDEWLAGSNRFDRPGEALYAAYARGALAGIGGRNIDPYGGDPRIARVRHVYVLPAFRRLGVGKALTQRIVAEARGSFDSIVLRTRNPEAAALYAALGFAPVAEETTTHRLALDRPAQ
jgi:GNAT superfamily N-acetyltransferase